MQKILAEIIDERRRQDEKWGEQNHAPHLWLAILLEEIGEASKEILEYNLERYRKEMVQAGAVVVAMIECLDRRKEEGKLSP